MMFVIFEAHISNKYLRISKTSHPTIHDTLCMKDMVRYALQGHNNN
jgi:hypothetical protein